MKRFKLQISDQNPNTRARSEFVFEESGHWDQNRGPDQTRRFGEFFHRYTHIPWKEFSVLDVGCALGDALPIWHERYPAAKLHGCDVAESAVKRCRHRYGDIAEFFRASFEEIEGFWDVIFCSNVLEHFEQHLEIAAALLEQCRVLMVLTPFGELRKGSLLRVGVDDYYHVTTFFRDSFDDLVRRGQASRIETVIFNCPGGWGFTPLQRVRYLLGTLRRHRYFVQEPLQILYAIHNPACPDVSFVRDDGRYPL
jgi:SAM-dependent methyltransferase